MSASYQDEQRLLGTPRSSSQLPRSRLSSLDDSPFSASSSSRISPNSVGDKAGSVMPAVRTCSDIPFIQFSLSPDPNAWGLDLSGHTEPDDNLHTPDPVRDKKYDRGGHIFTSRGLANIGCLALLAVSIVTLFAGFPIVTYLTKPVLSTKGGFNLGGVNASGQIPQIIGDFGLIDPDTPPDAYTFKSVHNGQELQLVFSDEFNREGRTFYPGDDPYWEAVDLHYWGTNNLEWYDPAALITENGSLKVTLSEKPSHDLKYEGGMMATWNKFCFTGGLIVASVMLPGRSNVAGLWPAVWTMGNLGRAGYGATNDGMWPYTYDACDAGTLPNQTFPNGEPHLATVDGDQGYGGVLSYLPGQRLSRCTCPGESHPGPMHKDGTYVGRAAPEIDMIEAQVGGNFQVPGGPLVGEVSQSGQWAPFNYNYRWFNSTESLIINDPTITELNPYMGGVYQQATSCVSKTNQACYSQMPNPCYATYGFEYKPGFDNSYITWLNDGKQVCTVMGSGMVADERVEIAARPVPQEPMYILINLGMSYNFGAVDLANMVFPVSMYVDWIRVYQDPNEVNIGCDPPNFPTKAYIDEYIEAYINPNLTTWTDGFGQPKPKNRLVDQC